MKKILFIILALCVASAFATGCKPAAVKSGVTDTSINVGQWGPQSGPAALWGAVARGTDCYFKMINDEGGIHGRKLNYFLRDDGYQPFRTKTEVQKLVEGEGIFAFVGGVGTATGMAVKQYLEDNKVFWIGPAAGSTHWTYPMSRYVFANYPLYCIEAAVLVDYSIDKMNKKKIAIFYQNDDYGKVGLHGAELALEKRGMKFVEKVSVETMDTDLSSHALKLKNSGADMLLLWVLPKHAAIMLGACDKINYRPQMMTSSTLSDMFIMHKITKGLWKDVIFCNFVDLPDSQTPLMKKYREAHKKYAPNERWGVFFYAGFVFAEPLIEGLKKCGKDLTTENFIKAMESIKDYQGAGAKTTFGPDRRQGTDTVFLSKCLTDSKAQKLTDWITSDINIGEVVKRTGQ